MEEILSDLNTIEKKQNDLAKIDALKKALTDAQNQHREHLNTSMKHVTTMFKTRLKESSEFNKVVDDYVAKYVSEELRETAKEDMYNILTGELIGMFNGLSHTTCTIM